MYDRIGQEGLHSVSLRLQTTDGDSRAAGLGGIGQRRVGLCITQVNAWGKRRT